MLGRVKDFCLKSFFAAKCFPLQNFLSQYVTFSEKKVKFRRFKSVSVIIHTNRTKMSKHLCPGFQGFCPEFRQIKTFEGALAQPEPLATSLLNTVLRKCE